MIRYFVEYIDNGIAYETALLKSAEYATEIFNEQIEKGNLANLIKWEQNPKYPDDERKGKFTVIFETFKP